MGSKLDSQMTELQQENEQLVQNIKAQEQEIDSIVQGLEAVVLDLEGGNDVLQGATTDDALRRDALSLDHDLARRRDKQSNRL